MNKFNIQMATVLTLFVTSVFFLNTTAFADCNTNTKVASEAPALKRLESTLGMVFRKVASGEEPQPLACSDISVNLRSIAVGFKCRTSKGGVFKRVERPGFGESWRDQNGVTWSDYLGNAAGSSWLPNRKKLCAATHSELPSVEDYKQGDALGMLEVIPNLENAQYWTSSPTYGLGGNEPDNNTAACTIVVDDAIIDSAHGIKKIAYTVGFADYKRAVRCIDRGN